jgi:hypothetical protein
MATSSQPIGPSDEGPPYRSFKELRSDPTTAVVFSPAAKRLFWPLDGVYPTAISVMKTPQSAGDLEPYFQQTPDRGGVWHEIAQLPLTVPKVSSVEASVYDLDELESDWVEFHKYHEGEPANPEYVTYGDLSDEDRPYADEPNEDGSWEEDSDTEFLIRCCGQDRPLRKQDQKLVITPAAGGDFVTVHDYVSGESSLLNLGKEFGRSALLADGGQWQLCIPGLWACVLISFLPRGLRGISRILRRRKWRGWWTAGRRTGCMRSRNGFEGIARWVLCLPRQPRFLQRYVRIETGDFHVSYLPSHYIHVTSSSFHSITEPRARRKTSITFTNPLPR